MKLLAVAVMGLAIMGCSDSDTLAKVNGEKISKLDFQQYLEVKGVKTQSVSSQKTVLENYAHRMAMAKSIEQQGIVDLASIEQKINDYRQQLLMNAYFDKYISENVDDVAIKNYYSSNAEQYEQIKAHVAHILFRTRSGMSEEEISAVKMQAFEASGKLKLGEQFEELASRLSGDKISAKKGGDMGWISRGSIDPKFSETAFSLKEGEVSEPIRTPFGFHLLKVLESSKTIKLAFDDVKGEIRHQLKAKSKQAELERLLADTQIEIFAENLAN